MRLFTELTPRQEAALEVLRRKGREAKEDGYDWKAELCRRKVRELLEGTAEEPPAPFGSTHRHFAQLRREASDA